MNFIRLFKTIFWTHELTWCTFLNNNLIKKWFFAFHPIWCFSIFWVLFMISSALVWFGQCYLCSDAALPYPPTMSGQGYHMRSMWLWLPPHVQLCRILPYGASDSDDPHHATLNTNVRWLATCSEALASVKGVSLLQSPIRVLDFIWVTKDHDQ